MQRIPEYIEREAAVKVAEKYGLANGSALGRHTGLADCIVSEIADIPTADVAPVAHGLEYFIRCKDCKYAAKAQWNKKGYRICPASHMEITDDDFCSYGERKE